MTLLENKSLEQMMHEEVDELKNSVNHYKFVADEWSKKYFDLVKAISDQVNVKAIKDHRWYLYLDYALRDDGSVGIKINGDNYRRLKVNKDKLCEEDYQFFIKLFPKGM